MICSTVQISASGISQLADGGIATTVPKDAIRRVMLAHDSRSRRPFLRFFAGFVLVVTGLIVLIAAFIMAEGGVYRVRIQSLTLGVPLAPIVLWLMVAWGLWLIIGVFRGRYNFLIETDGGRKKIFFSEAADIGEIARFAARANSELGYAIDLSIMDTMFVRDPEDALRSSRKGADV